MAGPVSRNGGGEGVGPGPAYVYRWSELPGRKGQRCRIALWRPGASVVTIRFEGDGVEFAVPRSALVRAPEG